VQAGNVDDVAPIRTANGESAIDAMVSTSTAHINCGLRAEYTTHLQRDRSSARINSGVIVFQRIRHTGGGHSSLGSPDQCQHLVEHTHRQNAKRAIERRAM
jgi:hypothetical protein